MWQASASGRTRPAPGRFVFIDALRGLAALSVVLFHANDGRHIDELFVELPGAARAIIENGDLGVQVFFVLSGFVIAHSMAKKTVSAGYVGRFMLRRSIRLDPPYWASMLLVIALGVLSTYAVPGKTYEVPSATDIAIHVAYLPVLLDRPLINFVYWTLCLEIQFYFVFSLVMWAVTLLRPRLGAKAAFYLFVIPATCFANLWALQLQPFDVQGLFTEHWYFFMAGVLVWNAIANPGDRAATPIAAANVLLLAAAGLVLDGHALGVGAVTSGAILVVGKLGAARDGVWVGSAAVSRGHFVQPLPRAQPDNRGRLSRRLHDHRAKPLARGFVVFRRRYDLHRLCMATVPGDRVAQHAFQPEDPAREAEPK